MKSQSSTSDAKGKRYAQIGWLAVFLLFLILTALAAWYHEPWEDELQSWLISRDLGLPGLWRRMAIEGHFILWNLCLLPFAKLGFPPGTMMAVAWCLNAFTGWLLLYRLPLPRWCAACLLFSAPMLYFFACMARPYILLPPLLFLTLQQCPCREEHPYRYGLCIAFIAHIHFFCEGIAAFLFLEWFWARRHCLFTRNSLALLLPPCSSIIACLEVIHAFQQSTLVSRVSDEQTAQTIFSRCQAQCYQFAEFWMGQPGKMQWAIPALLLLALFTLVFLWGRRGAAIFIWLGGAAWLLVCSVFLWVWLPQRIYLLLYLATFVVGWLLHTQSDRAHTRALAVLLALLAISTFWNGFHTLSQDVCRPYAGFHAAGAWLDAHYSTGQPVLACPSVAALCSAYAPRQVFYVLPHGQPRTFIDYCRTNQNLRPLTVSEVLPILLSGESPMVLSHSRYLMICQMFAEYSPFLQIETIFPFQDTICPTNDFCIVRLRKLK